MDVHRSTWRLAGEPDCRDAIEAALARTHATLWYGSHCFEFERHRDEGGNSRLRLEEVGRRLPSHPESPVLVLAHGGCCAEQTILGADPDEHLLRLGRALFADCSRAVDVEAASP